MNKYEIWAEGVHSTGDDIPAWKIGEMKGETFLEAVRKAMKTYPQSDVYYSEREGLPYFYGCRLYDNETDARKFNG